MIGIKKRTVGLYLEDTIIDKLKKISHIKSLETGKDISYLDLIRESIDKMVCEGKENAKS